VYFEGLAKTELSQFANSNDVSGIEQFGFKKGKGTTPCILKLLEKWIQC
jgi:hypothetical protein